MGDSDVQQVQPDVPAAGGIVAPADPDIFVADDYVEGELAPESDRQWLRLHDQMPRTALEATMRAATAVLTALGILLPAHLVVVSLHGSKELVQLVPDLFWIVGGALAFWALLPWEFFYRPSNVENIRTRFMAVVEKKRMCVIASAFALLAGLLFVIVMWTKP